MKTLHLDKSDFKNDGTTAMGWNDLLEYLEVDNKDDSVEQVSIGVASVEVG